MLRSLVHTLSMLALLGLSAAGCGGTSTAAPRATPATGTSTSAEGEPAGSSASDPHAPRGAWQHDCELRRAQCPAGCRMIGGSSPAQSASPGEDDSFRDDVELGPDTPGSLSGTCSSAASGAETECARFCCTGCPQE